MKKHIILIALLCIIANTSIYAQTNYLNEAKYISEVIKKIEVIKKNDKSLNVKFGKEIDKKTGKENLQIDTTTVNLIYTKLIQVNPPAIEKKLVPNTLSKPINGKKGSAPSGPGRQPESIPNKADSSTKNDPQETKGVLSIETQLQEKEAKKEELRYILYIMEYNNVDESMIAEVPEKFGAFDKDGQ